MNHIKKTTEPSSFTAWKQKRTQKRPNWKNLTNPQKTELRTALLIEQGHICCYCGTRLKTPNYHIEHFRPKSLYPELTFDYHNLILSCQGESEENIKKPIHCGHQKGNWFCSELIVSPLDPNCSEYFRYTGNGQILPTLDPSKEPTAISTITQLNLNISKLNAMRSKAIEAVLLLISELPPQEIPKIAQSLISKDSESRYRPFVGAISYILKQYY